MSSTYRVLCLSHDPATIAADGDWNRAHMAEEAITAGIEGHEQCDLLIGRYSYPLVEVGCPASKDRRGKQPCIHGSTHWVDVVWLRLLAVALREPTSTDLRHAADEAARNCWTPERVRRLGPELDVRLHQKAEVQPDAPLTRAAVRTVVLFVGSLVGWIDEVHGDQVDQITDAALAKIGGPAGVTNREEVAR